MARDLPRLTTERRAGSSRGALRIAIAWALLLALAAPARAEPEAAMDEESAAEPSPADLPAAEDSEASEDSELEPPEKDGPRPWLTLAEVSFANLGTWAVDRYLRQREWARIGPSAWEQNLTEGFEWDADPFDCNQIAHPYHGASYFNAARANGYGYWGSLPFTFLGSLQWELFFENERPSINDMVNTTLGGLILGEALFRLSSMVLDNGVSGPDRLRREALAALISPARGLNRLLTGEAWMDAKTPPEWRPDLFDGQLRAGAMHLGGEGGRGYAQFFFEMRLKYGDPMRTPLRAPLDAFTVSAQFSGAEVKPISHADAEGVLAATTLRDDEGGRLLLALMQRLEYADTVAYETGGQSFSASLLYLRTPGSALGFRAAMHLRAMALAGITSEYAITANRSYDYGPGLGLHTEISYGRWPIDYVRFEARVGWIHTFNGALANHLPQELGLHLETPLHGRVGVGGSVQLFRRDSFFRDQGHVARTTPQFRLFVTLH